MNKKKWSLLSICIVLSSILFSQEIADTTRLENKFSSVMAFATAPYVYYTTITHIRSTPILQAQDTANLQGVFYKNLTDMYYNNGLEELYIQDSFLIEVNEDRKSIWVNKVDIASKTKMNSLLATNKQMQALFKEKYTSQKVRLSKQSSRLSFTSIQKKDSVLRSSTLIDIDYLTKELLPVSIDIQLNLQQPMTSDALVQLKEQYSDNGQLDQLIQLINHHQYLVRMQKISLFFYDITLTKEKASKMPSWKDILEYDPGANAFTAKGVYKNFVVSQTF